MLSFEDQLWFGRMKRKTWQREEEARLDRLAHGDVPPYSLLPSEPEGTRRPQTR